METLIYIPTDLINENYDYFIEGDKYVVDFKNGTCKNVYYYNNYIVSDAYNCIPDNLISISKNNLTDNWHYRRDISHILFTASVYIVLTIFVLFTLLKVFRKGLNI